MYKKVNQVLSKFNFPVLYNGILVGEKYVVGQLAVI